MLGHQVIEKTIIAQIVYKDFNKLELPFSNPLYKICKTKQVTQ